MGTYDNEELEWFANFVDSIFGIQGRRTIEKEAEYRLHEITKLLEKTPELPGSIAESVLEWWLHR